MGCAPSKETAANTVVSTTLPLSRVPQITPVTAEAIATATNSNHAGDRVAPETLATDTSVSTESDVTGKSISANTESSPEIVNDSPLPAALLSVEVVQPDALEESIKNDKNEKESQVSALARSVVPCIPVSAGGNQKGTQVRPTTAKPVAFEIPLDDDMFKTTVVLDSSNSVPLAGNAVVAAPAESGNNAKLSLPKLALSNRDILAKLANTEERWKEMERAQQESRHKRRAKPSLSSQQGNLDSSEKKSSSATEDPQVLKQRLLEKEARAATRRARELLKLQSKLAKQDEHAKQVQERKKRLGKLSNEHLNLSWGGEADEEAKKKVFGKKLQDAVGIEGLMQLKLARKDEIFDNDSGKGSSAASVSNGSRSGSGRSLGFAEDGTEIIETL